jgi:hypothetical protein
MATNQDTKLQINFKTADGTLINLYAADKQELEVQIVSIRDLASQIISTASLLNNRSTSLSEALTSVQTSLGGQLVGSVPAAHQPAYEAPQTYDANFCKHGQRQYRESKPGAPKAWKGYFCPSPKGTPDQCEPNFVRG